MENLRKSSYAIVPSFILDDDSLEEGAKVLYARISMYSEEGCCWASNEHFAEKQKVTIRCIQKWLKQLKESGYIEVEIETGGFQTKRNIWIINDFKKQFTKRTTVHPPRNHSSPPPEPQFTHTNTRKTNIKRTTNKKKPDKPAVVVGFSDLVKSLDLTNQEKEAISKFSDDRIKLALEFFKTEPLKKDLISGLIWHCRQKIPPKPNGSSKKSLLSKFKKGKIYNGYECLIDEHGIGFIKQGMMQPYSVRHDSNNFKEELENLIKKLKI